MISLVALYVLGTVALLMSASNRVRINKVEMMNERLIRKLYALQDEITNKEKQTCLTR